MLRTTGSAPVAPGAQNRAATGDAFQVACPPLGGGTGHPAPVQAEVVERLRQRAAHASELVGGVPAGLAGFLEDLVEYVAALPR